MTNPKLLMEQHQLEPKRSLGQNFLHDPNALQKIIQTADIQPTDTILEIGAGTGMLTTRLAQTGAHIVAVEIDGRLVPLLHKQLKDYANVSIHEGDILKLSLTELVGNHPYKVVANLPYYITSLILSHILSSTHKPSSMVIMVQQEVAERMIARPNDMNILAVSIQAYGKPTIITKLNPAAFWPRPEVSSAVVRIDVWPQPFINAAYEKAFFSVVNAGFSQKRKQVKNSLGSKFNLSHAQAAELLHTAGIDPTRRAETLHLEEWIALMRIMLANGIIKPD